MSNVSGMLNLFEFTSSARFVEKKIISYKLVFYTPELFIRGLISAYRTILDQFSCCYGVVKPRCTVFAKATKLWG